MLSLSTINVSVDSDRRFEKDRMSRQGSLLFLENADSSVADHSDSLDTAPSIETIPISDTHEEIANSKSKDTDSIQKAIESSSVYTESEKAQQDETEVSTC